MPVHHRLRSIAFASLLLAGFSGGARGASAGMLASGILLSTDAERLDCFLSNVGSKSVSITGVQVLNGGFTILSFDPGTCDTLGPGGNCAFSADLDARFSARAVVEVHGGTKSLRGQCQLTTSTNHLVASTELR
jgi:hypothetical protein